MTEIKLDYDGRLPARLLNRIGLVCRVHRLPVLAVSVAPTRHGFHVTVVVRGRVSAMRLVLLQSLLGSDWKRELYNSRRAMAWRHVPAFWRNRANVLYKRHFKGVEI